MTLPLMLHKDCSMNKIDRVGETSINKQGCAMKIIAYQFCDDITVEFENGYIAKHKKYSNFLNGSIFNPLIPSVAGVGYIGVGKYKAYEKGRRSPAYVAWMGMFTRCYSKEYHLKYPTYKTCEVCAEWHNFQNFAQWYYDNYYEVYGQKMCLDKDLLVKGNKIYSPEFCVIIPEAINNTLTTSVSNRGCYSIGVHKRKRKYIAYGGEYKNRKSLGSFDSEHEAFLAYKNFKEQRYKELAELFKDCIPSNAYIALINRKVDEGD